MRNPTSKVYIIRAKTGSSPVELVLDTVSASAAAGETTLLVLPDPLLACSGSLELPVSEDNIHESFSFFTQKVAALTHVTLDIIQHILV